VLVAAVALLATAATVAWRLSRPPLYLATATFSVAEGELHEPGAAPRPPSAIVEYVWTLALDRARVLALMEKYGLSPGLRARDPVTAVDDMRAAIGIQVKRNEFLHSNGDDRRSAQVLVSLANPSRQLARGIVRDIGDTLIANQASSRRMAIEQAVESNARLMQSARQELSRAKANEQRRALDKLSRLRDRESQLAMVLDAERKGFGLAFERVDEAEEFLRAPLTIRGFVLLSFGLLCAFAVVSIAIVGAFDGRVLGPCDVLVRGFPLLGRMRAP
jgi:hypothetical protein